MIDHEVLSYVRDEMLMNPDVESHFIYTCTHLAENDFVLYALLNKWMKDIENRNRIEEYITERVNYLLSLDELLGDIPQVKLPE